MALKRILRRICTAAFRGLFGLLVAVLTVASAIGVAYAFPAPFFAHKAQVGQVRVYSDAPLDPSAHQFLSGLDVQPLLADLPKWAGPLDIYIAQGGWRQVFFIDLLADGAGGVTYTPVAPRHFFLSGADFAADTLVRDTYRITRPRSLTYYIRHETNHLAMAQVLGRIGLHTHPRWVIEGVADLAALGRPDRLRMLSWIGGGPTHLRDRVAFGSYPRERLLADWALHHRGMEFLLTSTLPEDDAWALMKTDGWGEPE